ncbi:MAG: cytochrome c oxidase assembly protein [Methylicorpusculum sp.]|uniref:cytochrome c oxidase assembly protein n=1 Tax=Methylicorpusculum sp. TaxID=2713644 RepID=UPI0027256FEB|nr:cytochrome c oxidase assembly protein [Methylicorpusculum sp.]MDO8939493.1 cytochrome c oxidase assembly protein [Methylicorpusculum sp.]MDP2200626.1 cytochrome c oxidase assembly protein [Methylicorpusculum sp.]
MSLTMGLLAFVVLPVSPAHAHGWIEGAGAAIFPEILGGLLLVLLWLSYCIGARRIRPTTGRSLTFHVAGLITALITFGPLAARLDNSSAMHMIQHMLIMVLIAPLYVLARPLPQWFAASGRTGINLVKPLLHLGRFPMRMCGLQGIAIWFWHAPKFYNLALESPWWHFAEHVSFALTASLFWWSILGRQSSFALPALLFTLMHTGMLGALLTFAQMPLYCDLHDIQDQQLAGLIMWVPVGLTYLVACVWISNRWLQ